MAQKLAARDCKTRSYLNHAVYYMLYLILPSLFGKWTSWGHSPHWKTRNPWFPPRKKCLSSRPSKKPLPPFDRSTPLSTPHNWLPLTFQFPENFRSSPAIQKYYQPTPPPVTTKPMKRDPGPRPPFLSEVPQHSVGLASQSQASSWDLETMRNGRLDWKMLM